MLNRFTVSQYKQFNRFKSLRRICRNIEKNTKEPYRIVECYDNLRTLCIMYKDDVIEMRKYAEYKMRKLIQEVMNSKNYHIERPQTYEEVSAELVKSCKKAIEALSRIDDVMKDEYVDR